VIASVAKKTELENEGKGIAAARKAMIEEIKADPDLEALRVNEAMAQGTSATLFLPFEKIFKSLKKLGG